MKRIFKHFTYYLLSLSFSLTALADYDYQYDITHATSVDDAVLNITQTLIAQQFEIIAVINHQQNADNVGLSLRPTQVILFRKKYLESSLVNRSTTAAIDLPFKILIYENESGEIKLKSNDIGYLIDRHEIPVRQFGLRKLDATMDQFGLNNKGLIFTQSQQNVAETILKLRDILLTAGFFIAKEIDYSKQGHHQKDITLLIFGNPNVGSLLMQNRQEIGLDLPQKFLVFKDEEGQVQIAHNNPRFIAQRAGIQGLDTLLTNVGNALNNFATQGAIP